MKNASFGHQIFFIFSIFSFHIVSKADLESKKTYKNQNKVELILAPVFIWCLTTPHTKTYIKLDFNAVQSQMYFFFLAYSVLNTSHTDQSWKVKSQLWSNSKFLCTLRHVNNICFVCAMHLVVHQVKNQTLLTNCCFHREPALAVIHPPRLSESSQWYLRATKTKAHAQIADTIKQFTGGGSGVSRVFDVLTYKPLRPLVDTAP